MRGAGGIDVIGPVASTEEATALLQSGVSLDAAVLDVNLGGEMAFPIADALKAREMPFAFTTGYDSGALPDRFAAVARVEKPLQTHHIVAALMPLLASC